MSHPNALLLCGEVAAVLAAMRSGGRLLSLSGRYGGESEMEDGMLRSLKVLRRRVFEWADWYDIEPLEYMDPFLQVVRSPETSGVVTDVALASVLKMLNAGLLAPGVPGIYEAMQALTESVTQCKFEATYPAYDECVLSRILDVLTAAVRSPAGQYLSHDNLLNVFQAVYRIGHYQTEKGRATSEVLTQASRRCMRELIAVVFSRLSGMLPADGEGGRMTPGSVVLYPTNHRLHVSPTPSVGSATNADIVATNGNAIHTTGDDDDDDGAVIEAGVGLETHDPALEAGDQGTTEKGASQPIAAVADGAGDAVVEGFHPPTAPSQASPSPEPPHSIVSLLSPTHHATSATSGAPGSFLSAGQGGGGGETGGPPSEIAVSESHRGVYGSHEGYGVEALCEILAFVIGFVSAPSTRQQHTDLAGHGLDLVSTALRAAGPALERHESLLLLLQQDLVKAMFAAARTANLATLTKICHVALALHVQLGRLFLLQIEALLGLLLLPLAEGSNADEEAHGAVQVVALEGVLDFCNQPGFARDVYLNLDCRIERSNLFEQICTLLSKAAFPVNGPLSAVHVLSLDGIVSMLSSLAEESSGNFCGGSSMDVSTSLPGPSEGNAAENSADGVANDGSMMTPPPPQPQPFVDIWTPLVAGQAPILPGSNDPASAARAEKTLKARLIAAAEHFNRDAKKGFQYAQSAGLLPSPLDPVAVARFLRCCPGLNKAGIGEVLGERDAFYDDVRDAFMQTFDFTGLEFETALRLYMDAFRPPGEGQKIDRLMQVFGKRYYEQMPESGLKSVDAAYVLAFSVIMLNTDLHNTQNKKKMSLEDFARINRNTNEGEPMPPQLLERIYRTIATDELKISSECAPEELPAQTVFWQQMARNSRLPRGHATLGLPSSSQCIERDMFRLVWGPTLAAVSVILDSSDDPSVARRATEGLLLAARLAAMHGIHDVPDRLIATLANYTIVLDPTLPRAAVAFGASEKGQAAVATTFAVANRYGDGLRSGWRQVLDCIMRLHKTGLLNPAIIAADGESMEEASARFPRPMISKTKGSSGSLFSRAINSLISIEGADDGAKDAVAAREQAAEEAARRTAETCRVEDLVRDSKFLTAESLVELIKATMWAGGNLAAALRTGEGSDSAELALELLITLTLRNRDRIALIWPLVHEYLAACTDPEAAEEASPLVERAVLGLLRICQRLLPYKDDTERLLLDSLALTVGLAPHVAWALAERTATEVLSLVRSCGPHIRTEPGWRTVAALIRLTAQRPEAAPAAYEALSVSCRDAEMLRAESFMPLMEICLQLIDRYKGGNPSAAAKFLDCADALISWLPTQGRGGGAGGGGMPAPAPAGGGRGGDAAAAAAAPAAAEATSTRSLAPSSTVAVNNSSTMPSVVARRPSRLLSDEALLDLWLTSVGVMARGLCREEARQLRDVSIASLHRTLLASSGLCLPPELWVQTIRELLVPLVADLARLAAAPRAAKQHPGMEKSVRLAASMLTKVLMQYGGEIASDRDFFELWTGALESLKECMAIKHEAVLEAVPENAKNMLLVLASSGLLVPSWHDVAGRSLWDVTWVKAAGISSALTPAMLAAAGVGGIDLQQEHPQQEQKQQQGTLSSPGGTTGTSAGLYSPTTAAQTAPAPAAGTALTFPREPHSPSQHSGVALIAEGAERGREPAAVTSHQEGVGGAGSADDGVEENQTQQSAEAGPQAVVAAVDAANGTLAAGAGENAVQGEQNEDEDEEREEPQPPGCKQS